MRSVKYLLRKATREECTQHVYRWLFSRAQYLVKHPQHHRPSKKTKSLFQIFQSLVFHYSRHVPIEYLCGSAVFYGRIFIVNRFTLIPRRDSECLIDEVREIYGENNDSEKEVLEIGTGSGCLSITLASFYPHWRIDACDISFSALRIARNNAVLHRCRQIQFHRKNIFNPAFFQDKRFDLIISNPPYISNPEKPLCDRGIFHEPAVALFVDQPLQFYSIIINHANARWLHNGGYLVFECSPFNVNLILSAFNRLPETFNHVKVRYDGNDLPRVVSARKIVPSCGNTLS